MPWLSNRMTLTFKIGLTTGHRVICVFSNSSQVGSEALSKDAFSVIKCDSELGQIKISVNISYSIVL